MLEVLDEVAQGARTGQGHVFKKTIGHYGVMTGGRTLVCSISNRLRKQLIYPIADPSSLRHHVMEVADIRSIDPVAIGDIVEFADAGDGTGLITAVLPRRNRLSRRAAGVKPIEQVIVANVDQVVLVMAAAHPTPNWELLDRYLAATESLELSVLVCITKLDLVTDEEIAAELETYRRIGYKVVLTSSDTGEGIMNFKALLKDKISVFVGKSGVGKTSLLNAVQPGLGLRVSEVSKQTDKGKHTTTNLEMFQLAEGGGVTDTPGMREFGLWNEAALNLDYLFVEMRPYIGQCRLGAKCSHNHEPGCRVKAAVANGEIAQRRYQSYLRMLS